MISTNSQLMLVPIAVFMRQMQLLSALLKSAEDGSAMERVLMNMEVISCFIWSSLDTRKSLFILNLLSKIQSLNATTVQARISFF